MPYPLKIVVTVWKDDNENAYRLRLPDGSESVVFDGEDDYWTIAEIVDNHFPVKGAK